MSKPFGDTTDSVDLQQGKTWATYGAAGLPPAGTPRFCAEGHSMIQWFDPKITECPLCAANVELEEIAERQCDE